MTTTIDYLDALKAKTGAPSDYALAKILNVSRACVSRYRNGLGYFDDEICLKVASILELPEIEVLLNVHAERSTSPLVKASLSTFLKQLATTAAVCLITTGINLVSPSPAYAEAVASTNPQYTLCEYIYGIRMD